jgi:Tfp pilus assembly protein PilN
MKFPVDLKAFDLKDLPWIRRHTQDLVGVDLTGGHVKVVRAKSTGEKMAVEDIVTRKFAEGEEDAMATYLASVFRDLRIRTKEAVAMVPATLFISKNVDIPSKDLEEIGKIVELQAGRYTPYSREEIVIDYLCRESPGQHYTNVLLVIINRNVVSRLASIFEKAGIEFVRMAIASEGMAASYGEIAQWVPGKEAVGGIHIAHQYSDLVVVDQGQMVFVRSLPVGAFHFRTAREGAETEFASELAKSLAAYQDQGIGKPVRAVVVAGLIEGLGFLEELLASRVPSPDGSRITVKMVNYQSHFDFSAQALAAVEAEPEVSFFEVLAPLAHLARTKIDLLPKPLKLKRRFRQGSKDMIRLGVLIMSGFLMMSLFLVSKIYLRNMHTQRLDEVHHATYDQARVLERASTKSRLLRNLLDNRGKGLYVFERVTTLIGEDISLANFSYNKEGEVSLAGTADSMSRVFAFVTELEESNYFQEVKTEQTKSRREGAKEVADFEIGCLLAEGI